MLNVQYNLIGADLKKYVEHNNNSYKGATFNMRK